jgi:hypothetical protein
MKNIAFGASILILGGCTAIDPVAVQPFASHDQFILLDNLSYKMGSSNAVLTVPAGFVTDYASIPRGFWSIAPKQDTYSEAAIVHDYLYWTQSCTRSQADNIFYIAMKEASVNPIRRWFIYRAVQVAGQASWNDNQVQVKAHLPRFVPTSAPKPTAKDSWPLYRKMLTENGALDPETGKDLLYCSVGDSTHIPTGFYKMPHEI